MNYCLSAVKISASPQTRLFVRFLATKSLLPAVTVGYLQRALKSHHSHNNTESDQVDNFIIPAILILFYILAIVIIFMAVVLCI